MSRFQTLNSTIEKDNYTVDVKNIDSSSSHWGNEKDIIKFFDTIEDYFYDKSNFDNNIIQAALSMKKYNPRIKELRFYEIPEENKIILFVVTAVRKFKSPEYFTREMSAKYRLHNKTISIVEMVEDEMKEIEKDNKTVPENWKPMEQYNASFERFSVYCF